MKTIFTHPTSYSAFCEAIRDCLPFTANQMKEKIVMHICEALIIMMMVWGCIQCDKHKTEVRIEKLHDNAP